MAGSYIPASDAGFDDWVDNFSTLLTADPTAYGEDAGVAATVAGDVAVWDAAYALAIDPSTRTPSAVADKDAARATLDATVRPVAMRINANPVVTNMQRSDLGLTIRDTTRTPVPAPSTAPTISMRLSIPNQQTLSIRDETTPTTKAKPAGVIGVEIWRSIGVVAATDPSQCSLVQTSTRTPVNVANTSGDMTKLATYFARWVTRSGPGGVAQVGPWSAPLTTVLQ